MYARLLSRADYDALLPMKSVSNICAYLKKQTPYSEVLGVIDDNDVHRGQIEQVLKKSLFNDYERLIKFTTGKSRAVLRAMFDSYEIDDLKLVIGSICSENEHYLTPADLTYVSSYAGAESPGFTVDALLGADTAEDLAGVLKGTRYYEPLAPFAVRSNPDFLKIDHALNLLNYHDRMNAYDEPPGSGRNTAASLFSARASIDNILFIYRIKKLYGFMAKDIVPYLIPCVYRIANSELLELAECDSLGDLTDRIGKTWFGFLFPSGRESEWENIQMEYFYNIYRRNLHTNSAGGSGGGAMTAISYLYLKETDIRNIINIIEGVRYSLPSDRIASFLIGHRH